MSLFIRAASLKTAGLRERSGLAAADWNALPCIVGSSSHSIGRVENDPEPALAPPIEFARELARGFGVSGPVLCINNACTSGLMALQIGLDLIENGAFRHALVLGAELPNRFTATGFRSLGLDLKLGSALGALVLSTEGSWKIAALAWQVDPSSLTGISVAATEAAMREALSQAGWRASDVDLVKLQADHDPAERRAIAAVFGSVPSTVSYRTELGHTLGASGPAELALLLQRSERRMLFNLSGFGGQVASLALERA